MAETTKGHVIHPEMDSIWVAAKKSTPRRAPYTDAELVYLRQLYSPRGSKVAAEEAVVIWTLLDMLEEQRGWKLPDPPRCLAWVVGSPGPAGGWRCKLPEGHSGPHSPEVKPFWPGIFP